MATIYEHIEENKRRTVLLVLLFPLTFALLVTATVGILFYLMGDPYAAQRGVTEFTPEQLQLVHGALIAVPVCWALAVLWIVVSYFMGDKLMLSGAGAIEISRSDQPEIFRLVENLCITRGLPLPRIYILDDDSLNAFATGRDPEHASIALTKGIVKKLERVELEGVIAHELAHVENRDIRLMLITVAGISFFTFAGEMLIRFGLSSGRGSKKNSGGLLFILLGIFFLVYGYLIAPLIRLAVSRQREYQADATAALTTRNPRALASALHKISGDSRVEALDKRESMAAMCIANPLEKMGLFSALSGLLATHPPIQKRIDALLEMDGHLPL
ncbi:M48 family metallopeptidase [Candidatus Avelusimicrobium luingense]|uniref:M48 family metallopeptidase n=1 Tax=Candidatus Avelusimicrobium luingense TaxID=3416211 RepID=UPI003D0EB80B